MKVYVGTISYNASPLIGSAIKSVAKYAEKIIVVDGGPYGPSTDSTVAEAKAAASNVETIQGIYRKTDGSWDEIAQRRVYEELVPKGKDVWCLMLDADEVYDEKGIKQLLWHIESASPMTMAFAHLWYHFVGDADHIKADWLLPSKPSVYRTDHEGYKLVYDKRAVNYSQSGPEYLRVDNPTCVRLWNVVGFHYGHAMTIKRRLMKERVFVAEERLNDFDATAELEKNISHIVPFTGKHPVEMEQLIERGEI
jgi:glycosyltransferase involved in cell wall biosynthesis